MKGFRMTMRVSEKTYLYLENLKKDYLINKSERLTQGQLLDRVVEEYIKLKEGDVKNGK